MSFFIELLENNNLNVSTSFFLAPFFCEFLLFLLSLCYLFICCFANVKWWEKTIIFRLFFWIRLLLFLLILLNFYVIYQTGFDFVLDNGAFFGNILINSFGAIFIKNFILFLSFFCISNWFSFIFLNRLNWKSINEFAFIFLSCLFFLIVLISLNDFFSVLFIIVALSIALYGLILINFPLFSNTPELGAKYFLLSVVSVGLMFGGIKEIFLISGHLNFSVVQNSILEKIINCINYIELFSIKYAIFFLIVGFLFKLAAAPNHFWAPEIYAGLPYALLLFFVVPVKFVLSFIFFKIIKIIFFILFLNNNLNYILYNESEIFLIFAIFFSMFIGGINAIFEQNMRKFIAYSSINQIGFLLIGLIGFNSFFFCFESFLYFIFIYFINLFLFLLFFVFFSQTIYMPNVIWKNIFNSNNKFFLNWPNILFFEFYLSEWIKIYTIKIIFIKDLSKIYNIRYFIQNYRDYKNIEILLFIFIVFSLAGVPPFPGFYSKFYILLYSVQMQNWIIFWTGIFTSILSVIYYLRLLKVMFFEKQIAVFSELQITFMQDFYNIIFPFWLNILLKTKLDINKNFFEYNKIKQNEKLFLFYFIQNTLERILYKSVNVLDRLQLSEKNNKKNLYNFFTLNVVIAETKFIFSEFLQILFQKQFMVFLNFFKKNYFSLIFLFIIFNFSVFFIFEEKYLNFFNLIIQTIFFTII